MVKYIFSIPIILFPYALLMAIYCVFSGFMMDLLNSDNFPGGFLLVAALLLYCVIAYGITFAIGGVCLLKKSAAESMAKFNMIIKLCQIPAYLIIFALGLLCCVLSVWGIPLIILLIFYDLLSIIMTGLIGATAVIRSCKEQKCSKSNGLKFAVCQFVFCVDIIAAVKLYLNAKK